MGLYEEARYQVLQDKERREALFLMLQRDVHKASVLYEWEAEKIAMSLTITDHRTHEIPMHEDRVVLSPSEKRQLKLGWKFVPCCQITGQAEKNGGEFYRVVNGHTHQEFVVGFKSENVGLWIHTKKDRKWHRVLTEVTPYHPVIVAAKVLLKRPLFSSQS